MATEYTEQQVIQAGKDLVDLLLNVAKSNNNLTGFIKEYLIQLTSNNGIYKRQQENEWYLQNGDEIQLSTNGPKLGFIIPEGRDRADQDSADCWNQHGQKQQYSGSIHTQALLWFVIRDRRQASACYPSVFSPVWIISAIRLKEKPIAN